MTGRPRPAWMPPGLRLPPRADPDYQAAYDRARREHDPAYRRAKAKRDALRYATDPAHRAAVKAGRDARRRAAVEENAEGRDWRGRRTRRSLDRLKAAGWSYARIGRALGVGKNTVYRWATGRHLPTEANAAALGRLADRAEAVGRGRP